MTLIVCSFKQRLYFLFVLLPLVSVYSQVGINTTNITPGITLEVNGAVKITQTEATATPDAGSLLMVTSEGEIVQKASGRYTYTAVIVSNEVLATTANQSGATFSDIAFDDAEDTNIIHFETEPFTTTQVSDIAINANVPENIFTESGNNVAVVTWQYKLELRRLSDDAIIGVGGSQRRCSPCLNNTSGTVTIGILTSNVPAGSYYFQFQSIKVKDYNSDNRARIDIAPNDIINVEITKNQKIEF